MAMMSTEDAAPGRTWSSDGLVGFDLDDGASSENANKNVWNTWLPNTSLPLGIFMEDDADEEQTVAKSRAPASQPRAPAARRRAAPRRAGDSRFPRSNRSASRADPGCLFSRRRSARLAGARCGSP